MSSQRNRPNTRNHITHLPDDVLNAIVTTLNSKNMVRLAQTSKKMKPVTAPRLKQRKALQKALRASRMNRVDVIKRAIYFARALFEARSRTHNIFNEEYNDEFEQVQLFTKRYDIGNYTIRCIMKMVPYLFMLFCDVDIIYKRNNTRVLRMELGYDRKNNHIQFQKLSGNPTWISDARTLMRVLTKLGRNSALRINNMFENGYL